MAEALEVVIMDFLLLVLPIAAVAVVLVAELVKTVQQAAQVLSF